MTLNLQTLKDHCRVDFDDDNTLLTRMLSAAIWHVEKELGFTLDDTDELPDGAPDDLEQAVLLIAAHWYENREASLVGLSAMPLPSGAGAIIANYRTYSFEAPED